MRIASKMAVSFILWYSCLSTYIQYAPAEHSSNSQLNGIGAIIYLLVQIANVIFLNVYQYFKLLLTEIPKHMNDTDLTFIYEFFHRSTCP